MNDIYHGDSREVRTVLSDNSIDTIITDPPYGLEFMGKGWDKGVPGIEFWKEFLAVTKPGGMLLAFGGTRTFHRMTVAIEDAGWEIRDCMMWLYGSGFPKSLDISNAIDKAKGAEREVIGKSLRHGGGINKVYGEGMGDGEVPSITAPATSLAREWSGWGTALKPAWEPIIVAMKPLDGTFAHNAETWGVAGINVDGGRIRADDGVPKFTRRKEKSVAVYGDGINGTNRTGEMDTTTGRWPANLILDEEAAGMLDGASGDSASNFRINRAAHADNGNTMFGIKRGNNAPNDSGGASRFFYCAKASKSERGNDNSHPTVKPLKLMEYLCTLTKTPTGGIVLDPFAGSGTTLLAAKNTGRQYVGIEQNEEYIKIIEHRLGVA